MKKLCTIGLFLIFYQSTLAQEKDITLPPVSVTALPEKPSGSIYSLDSIGRNPGTQLTGLLNQTPGLYLKNYGPGGLATIGLRGTASTHTALLWNGLPLNNAMLGQSDMSLVSGPLTSGATLQMGGVPQGAVSENFGGIIELGNPATTRNEIQVGSSVGSFRNLQNWLEISQSIGKSHLRLKVWHMTGQNNFSYYSQGELRTQTHALRKQKGLEISSIHPILPNLKLELAGWSQHNFRELAPAIAEARSESTQKDENLRLVAKLKWAPKLWKLEVAQGFTQDHLDYQNPIARISSPSQITSLFSWIEAKRSIGNWNLGGTAWFGDSKARTSNYDDFKRLSRISVLAFGSYSFSEIPASIRTQVKAEQAFYSGKSTQSLPILPSITGNYKNKWLGEFTLGVHRKYRLPTLNDLYWNPGGNPNLIPEQGWSGEITWNRKVQICKNFTYEMGLEHFRTWINHYIQWLPQGNYWTPQNSTAVRISGVQFNQKLRFQAGKHSLTVGVESSITRSIQAKSRFDGDEGVGNQLIYIPVYQSIERLQYAINSFHAEVWLQHCSQRFLSPGNDASLPSYYTLNGRISYTCSKVKKTDFQFFAEGINLTDQSYQAMSGFAMPLAQFSGGLQIKFNN